MSCCDEVNARCVSAWLLLVHGDDLGGCCWRVLLLRGGELIEVGNLMSYELGELKYLGFG